MKKYLAITAALALALTACGQTAADKHADTDCGHGSRSSPRRAAAKHRQRHPAAADRRCGRRVLSGVQRL